MQQLNLPGLVEKFPWWSNILRSTHEDEFGSIVRRDHNLLLTLLEFVGVEKHDGKQTN